MTVRRVCCVIYASAYCMFAPTPASRISLHSRGTCIGVSIEVGFACLFEPRASEHLVSREMRTCGVGSRLAVARIRFQRVFSHSSQVPTALPRPVRVCWYSRNPKLSPSKCRLSLLAVPSSAANTHITHDGCRQGRLCRLYALARYLTVCLRLEQAFV